jgi:hypothetical protein
MSVAPPGANPTMNRTGLLGYADGACNAVRMNPADRASSPQSGLRLTCPDAPPSAKPTMNRTGLLGYADGACNAVRMKSCAIAGCSSAQHSSMGQRVTKLRQ